MQKLQTVKKNAIRAGVAMCLVCSALAGAARYALASRLAWCEALCFDKQFRLAKGSIRGKCHRNSEFRCSIENFEYQMIVLEDGAKTHLDIS